jgi:hypothetical protein
MTQYTPNIRSSECFKRGFYATLGGLVAFILVNAAVGAVLLMLVLAAGNYGNLKSSLQPPAKVSRSR